MRAIRLPDMMKGFGRNSLDMPVAALAALATAWLAFAIPPDLLAGLVGASGLSALIPAAEPPLGNNARLLLAGAGAAAIFFLVFLLLRLLDRSAGDARVVRRPDPVAEPPRIRRRDSHPDAPPRRPILASLDFGDPEIPAEPAPVPLWLSPAEAESEPEIEPEIQPEIHRAEAGGEAPEPVAEPAMQDDEIPSTPKPACAQQRPTAGSESISELMARLETGLSRSRKAKAPSRAAEPPVGERRTADPLEDDRLQSAIDSLQQLAARIS